MISSTPSTSASRQQYAKALNKTKTGADSDSSRYHRGTRQVPKDTALLIDGTLLPYWRWKAEKTIFSGKHRHSGVNVQSRH